MPADPYQYLLDMNGMSHSVGPEGHALPAGSERRENTERCRMLLCCVIAMAIGFSGLIARMVTITNIRREKASHIASPRLRILSRIFTSG